MSHKNGIKKAGRSFSNYVCHKNRDFFPFRNSSFSSLYSQRIQNFFRIFAKNENAKKLASVVDTDVNITIRFGAHPQPQPENVVWVIINNGRTIEVRVKLTIN